VSPCIQKTSIKYLRVDRDLELFYKTHITHMCKTTIYNMFRILRKYLTVDAYKTIIRGLVFIHLKNSNRLFYEISDTDIKKLKQVQNAATNLVLRKGKYNSPTSCLSTNVRILSSKERHMLTGPSSLVDLNYGMNYRPISEISNQLHKCVILS